MLTEFKNLCKFVYLVFTNQCRFINILPRLPEIHSEETGLIHTNNTFIDYNSVRYIDTTTAMAVIMDIQYSTQTTFSKLRKHSNIKKFESGEFNETCGICIEKMKKKDIVRELDCKHCFHVDCIDQWFEKKCCCPYCNQAF